MHTVPSAAATVSQSMHVSYSCCHSVVPLIHFCSSCLQFVVCRCLCHFFFLLSTLTFLYSCLILLLLSAAVATQRHAEADLTVWRGLRLGSERGKRLPECGIFFGGGGDNPTKLQKRKSDFWAVTHFLLSQPSPLRWQEAPSFLLPFHSKRDFEPRGSYFPSCSLPTCPPLPSASSSKISCLSSETPSTFDAPKKSKRLFQPWVPLNN